MGDVNVLWKQLNDLRQEIQRLGHVNKEFSRESKANETEWATAEQETERLLSSQLFQLESQLRSHYNLAQAEEDDAFAVQVNATAKAFEEADRLREQLQKTIQGNSDLKEELSRREQIFEENEKLQVRIEQLKTENKKYAEEVEDLKRDLQRQNLENKKLLANNGNDELSSAFQATKIELKTTREGFDNERKAFTMHSASLKQELLETKLERDQARATANRETKEVSRLSHQNMALQSELDRIRLETQLSANEAEAERAKRLQKTKFLESACQELKDELEAERKEAAELRLLLNSVQKSSSAEVSKLKEKLKAAMSMTSKAKHDARQDSRESANHRSEEISRLLQTSTERLRQLQIKYGLDRKKWPPMPTDRISPLLRTLDSSR